MSKAPQDPFSIAFDGIWETLETSDAFCAAVKEGNRIKYNLDNRQPDKTDTMRSADFPEVRIIPMRGVIPHGSLAPTSSSTFITKNYQIQAAMGDLRVDHYLHPLEFIVLCALINWQAVLLGKTWKEKAFINHLRVSEVADGRRKADMDRGIQSWSAMFSVAIEMHFTTRELLNLAPGDVFGGWQ